jgi:acetyl esterase
LNFLRSFLPFLGNNSPAVVYFHGGGWVLGDVDGYSPTCSHLANHSGYVILSVNYRKSPEHPCPAAFDDCFDAMKYIAANGPALKIDGSRLAVAGDSAGG